MKPDNCPVCDNSNMKEVVKPTTFKYKRYGLVIPSTLQYYCEFCGDSFYDKEQQKEWEPLIGKFQQMINETVGK